MKRAKWYLGLLLVGILLFVGGCAEEPSLPVPPSEPVTPTGYSDICIPIGEFSYHSHIDVVMHAVVGGELTVTLGSNPTTGFQWSEFAGISDETIIRQVDHKFVGPGIDKPPGTPGEEVWIFEALKKGTVTTFLEYSRPWESADTGLWTVTITTTIE
ncbi:hypothetical protein ES706_03921 [subsurface metagenome]|nr:hypothetical protein [Dehalococcoidia bacterium]